MEASLILDWQEDYLIPFESRTEKYVRVKKDEFFEIMDYCGARTPWKTYTDGHQYFDEGSHRHCGVVKFNEKRASYWVESEALQYFDYFNWSLERP